jgi:hypothetical protein
MRIPWILLRIVPFCHPTLPRRPKKFDDLCSTLLDAPWLNFVPPQKHHLLDIAVDHNTSTMSPAVGVAAAPHLGDFMPEKPSAMVGKPVISGTSQATDGERLLVVSPYTEKEHLLDLDTLDDENQLLALALTQLQCMRTDDYATAPYSQTFNWAEVIDILRGLAQERNHNWKATSWYIVAFRSQIPPTTVYEELGALDKAAHAEATASGGFLK